jgi:BASS family bile acid:Na+ symporter
MLAGTMVEVDTLGMLLSIVYVVIAPIVCGLLCQSFLPGLTRRVTPYLPSFSSVVIALLVGIIVAHNADRLLSAGLTVLAVVMAHNLLGLSIGFLVGHLLRLQQPKCAALSIEVGMQNSGLASSLAVLHFAAYPLATIPGAVFSVWHNISGALVAKLYQVRISRSTTQKIVKQ